MRLGQRLQPDVPAGEGDGCDVHGRGQEYHNCEIPESYTVFPYGQYGIGKPELQVAIDTARYAPETEEQKTHISWHQQGIQYARLAMLPEALDFLCRKRATRTSGCQFTGCTIGCWIITGVGPG